MPWKETCPMEERERFIEDWLCGDDTFKDLCGRYGIHRSKGYKWRNRYLRLGIAGLVEQSRAAKTHPNQTPNEICEVLIELRRKHPRWGAAKLLAILSRKNPGISLPASSTAHEILKRAGLVDARRRKKRPGRYNSTLSGYYGPNAVWGADFKGYFLTKDKLRCNPLTVSDLCSRYLLRCSALAKADKEKTKKVFARAFCEYGLPEAIRSDNGPPFSGSCGLSELSVWWIRLGIRPERITRGRPTENGIHERIHKTMDDEYATVPKDDLRKQQRSFDRFRKTYNDLRPHHSLGLKTPSEVYCHSTRTYPTKERSPEYPDHYEVIRVDADGRIRCKGNSIYLSKLIANEPIGICNSENDSEIWYGPQFLGTLNPRGMLRRGRPKSWSKKSVSSSSRRSNI